MTEEEIRAWLDEAEAAVERGEGLKGTGFWKAVGAVKREPELAPRYAGRIADIDRRAFVQWPQIVLSMPVGTALAFVGTGAGVAAISFSFVFEEPWDWLAFGGGVAAVLGATHGLAHLLVGRAVGIRFSHWFSASITKPQPGVKVDYATYLVTPARKRAWMHVSGALLGKVIPFIALPVAVAADLPEWVVWALGIFGVGQIVTDALWSTKKSDWSRFFREMEYARD